MWLKRAAGAVAILALALCSLPRLGIAQGVPTTFNNGPISGLNANVQVPLSGQSTCRVNLNNASGFVGNVQIELQSLGDTAFVAQTFYDDAGAPHTGVTGNGNWTVYAKSAGTLEAIATSWSNGSIQVEINCTPASGPPAPRDSNGYEYVDIGAGAVTPPPYIAPTCPAAPNAPCVQVTGPLPSPASTLPVTTPPPYVAPTCPAAPNAPCVQLTGLPQPLPVTTPAPAPTGTNGAVATENNVLAFSCVISSALGHCNSNLPYQLSGQNTCDGNAVASGTAAGTVYLRDFQSQNLLGSVTTSGGTIVYLPTTALVVAAGGSGASSQSAIQAISLGVSTFSGSGNITINLYCSTQLSGLSVLNTPGVNVQNTPGVTIQNTPAVNQGTSPWVVTTPAPIATVSPGAAPAAGLCSGLGCLAAIGDTAFAQSVTTTLTQMIAAPAAGKSVRITAIVAEGTESATGGAIELEYGTGTNCATGTTVLSVLGYLNPSAEFQLALGSGYGTVVLAPAAKAVCVVITAGTVLQAAVSGTYTVY